MATRADLNKLELPFYPRWTNDGKEWPNRELDGDLFTKGDYERLFAKIDHQRDESDCWEWTAGVDRWGYPRLRMGTQIAYVHRVIYEMYHEKRPPKWGSGRDICHNPCDNKRCVNPRHLRDDTHEANMHDRHHGHFRNVAKGLSRLTPEDRANTEAWIQYDKNPKPLSAEEAAEFEEWLKNNHEQLKLDEERTAQREAWRKQVLRDNIQAAQAKDPKPKPRSKLTHKRPPKIPGSLAAPSKPDATQSRPRVSRGPRNRQP